MANLFKVTSVGTQPDGTQDEVIVVNRDHIISALRRTKPEKSTRSGLEYTVLKLSTGDSLDVHDDLETILG